MTRRLILFGRPDCHLCDEAREILQPMIAGADDIVLSEVDIEGDDQLLAQYLERIPVITLDGVVVCELVPDPDAISAVLLHTSAR